MKAAAVPYLLACSLCASDEIPKQNLTCRCWNPSIFSMPTVVAHAPLVVHRCALANNDPRSWPFALQRVPNPALLRCAAGRAQKLDIAKRVLAHLAHICCLAFIIVPIAHSLRNNQIGALPGPMLALASAFIVLDEIP